MTLRARPLQRPPRTLGHARDVLALVALSLTACSSSGSGSVSSTTSAAQRPGSVPPLITSVPPTSDVCALGEPAYVRSGLFARLPPEATLDLSSTADEVPHAEAGATLSIAGATVEIWRALQYGPDAVPGAAGRLDNGASVFVRADDPVERACLLAGLRYDPSQDVD